MLKKIPSKIAPKIHEIYAISLSTPNFCPILAVITKNVRGIELLKAKSSVFFILLKCFKNTITELMRRTKNIAMMR